MVPSWTETLLWADVQVVGRTRFCIHPKDHVKEIPVFGGTKDLDRNKLFSVKADYLVLDREENPKWMADESPIPILDTHIQSVHDLPNELQRMSALLRNQKLDQLARKWQTIIDLSANESALRTNWQDLPGVIQWVHLPNQPVKKVLYVIWKDPWMVVSHNTFIGSMLDLVGAGTRLPSFDKKYPELDILQEDRESTLLLFSSEPYPFCKKIADIQNLGFPSALVDGELFSWFGLRSLKLFSDDRFLTPTEN